MYDSFRPLSDDEKWNGITGEKTSCTGFQVWTRHKQVKDKTLVISGTLSQTKN